VARKRQPKRNTRGLGSVHPVARKRNDGTSAIFYRAVFKYRDTENKPQRVVEYAKSLEEATEKLKAMHTRPEIAARIAPARGTVGDFIETWLKAVKAPNVRPSTAARYFSTYRAHIKSSKLSAVPLGKVKGADVDRLNSEMIVRGLGPSTRLKVHDLLSGAFQYGLLRKQIAADPMFGIKRPVYEAPAVLSLAREQIESLLVEIIKDPLCAFYAVAIGSGMREGELFSLTWSSVDFDFGIHVNVALQDTGVVGAGPAKRITGAVKTRTSKRPIQLTTYTLATLREHHASSKRVGPNDLVFPNALGKPMWRQNLLRRSFRPLLKRAGLVDEAGDPLLTFHDLRHVHATELFRQGVHPKVVQERLGHSRISITLDLYSSSIPSLQQTAVDALALAFPPVPRKAHAEAHTPQTEPESAQTGDRQS
jgi:integrase